MIEAASTSTTTTTVSKIDTSGVQLRNKPKRNRVANCVPYVVPRFDDLEEDTVKVGLFGFTADGLSSNRKSICSHLLVVLALNFIIMKTVGHNVKARTQVIFCCFH